MTRALADLRSVDVTAWPSLVVAKRVMITGPFACGKTTLAMALAQHHLGIQIEANTVDVQHINGGTAGIEDVKRFAELSRGRPFDGRARCRAFVLDEIHALPDKASQALLLPLEADKHNFWAACTTRPDKVDPGLLSRFSYHVDLGAPAIDRVVDVLLQEGVDADEADRRARACAGDLRVAIAGRAGVIDADDNPLRSERALLAAAMKSPRAVQLQLLESFVGDHAVHAALCGNYSDDHRIAAHQLLAACRKHRLIGTVGGKRPLPPPTPMPGNGR